MPNDISRQGISPSSNLISDNQLFASFTDSDQDSFCGWSNYYEFTDRISFHDVSFGAADHHNDLSLEGDDQHRALLHHLSHCQLQTNEPSSVNRAQCSSFATESL